MLFLATIATTMGPLKNATSIFKGSGCRTQVRLRNPPKLNASLWGTPIDVYALGAFSSLP